MSYKNEGDEATKWFLRHHFRNHGLTVLRYFLKRGFMETLVKAYNICVTMVAQGHRHQLSIPLNNHARNIGAFRSGAGGASVPPEGIDEV